MEALAASIIILMTCDMASSMLLLFTTSDVIFANEANLTQSAASNTYLRGKKEIGRPILLSVRARGKWSLLCKLSPTAKSKNGRMEGEQIARSIL
ncbi:hypothetical protein AVEN_253693-1 [Araneus ventricosus]|uniref:Uncharacterized protein n=1 Tax=Araneus ventricosus TaxID=182803 RepID=A0A4Y2N0A0_ARAVE|nr:hypothetical protein AVEN_253693-1 [Araneus ventricosus]